jgi:tRNA (mo5U34)-methyltransferase
MTDHYDICHRDRIPYDRELMARARKVLDSQPKKAMDYASIIAGLPPVTPSRLHLDSPRIVIGNAADLTPDQKTQVQAALGQLKPWRKGPFSVFGTDLDSEWNSALKWQRIAPYMAPLHQRRVLDVGSSNGYYLMRMLPAGPRSVLGIEPYWVYYYQYRLLRYLAGVPDMCCLPLHLADLKGIENAFDTVFCMGVLYHSRLPLELLGHLRELLVPGGELILETLIIESDRVLQPRKRYAGMRNIYAIPSVNHLIDWLKSAGFDNIRCVDITRTTPAEQRKTEWIDSYSLDTFLDTADPTRTIEGYPGPVRAFILANR